MIAATNVTKQYGGQVLFVKASFQVNPGEKVGLVGPNGAGKTTIFRMMTGEETADDGAIEKPKMLTVGFFRQDVGELGGRSVRAETIAGAGPVAALGEQMAAFEAQMTEPDADMDAILERYGEVQARYQDLGGYELSARADAILAGLGFEDDRLTTDVSTLSGGWKMRVALAQILLAQPELLLLDEPTNYLDIESILWLEEFLRSFPGAVVMTCHDRDIMNRVAKKIIEIDGGEIRTYTGNYDFYEHARELEKERREAEYTRQQSMLAKESRFIERFKAQAAKAAQVQSRIKKLDKIEKIEAPRRIVERTFNFRPPPRSGDDVVKLASVSKSYGTRIVHDNLEFLVRRKQRWAVMGENGAGKSTLLKMIAGVLQPDDGVVTIGGSVTMGYYAQHLMDGLTGEHSVLGELQELAPTVAQGPLRTLAAAFGFHGDDVEKKVRVLSGGERARLALAKLLYVTPNFLVLDEPTNHLDILTKRMLVRTLSGYEGTIIFVSHDRQFLRALATKVLELSSDGPRVFPGSYGEYVESNGAEAPGMRSLTLA